MPSLTQPQLERRWYGQLDEYITALAWSPQGILALSTGDGEVWLVAANTQTLRQLRSRQGGSIDSLAFSADGQMLAAAGQDGQLQIWQIAADSAELIGDLTYARTWVEGLTWHPHLPLLGFCLGRYVQVWDAAARHVVTTLPFETSSVLSLAWHPAGHCLVAGGHQAIKLWPLSDWDAEPALKSLAAASLALAFSPSGTYLASGNLDRSLLVWADDNPSPWRMQGFPGKVRQVAWSDVEVGQAPLLAAASADGIVTWTKTSNATDGWQANVLSQHRGRVNAIAFQPGSLLLASAAEYGWLCLWRDGRQLSQILEGAPGGFSCLSWHPNGQLLATGGQRGEWQIWGQRGGGRGFQPKAKRRA